MMDGWIKLYRKLVDSAVFKNEGLFKVWIWCLLKASHKKTWVSFKTGKSSTEIELLPGQFIFGRKMAAKELNMSTSTVRNRIKKLGHLHNLKIQPKGRQYSVITLLNWHFYQNSQKEDNNKDNKKDNDSNLETVDNSSLKEIRGEKGTSIRIIKGPYKGHTKDINNNVNNEKNVNTFDLNKLSDGGGVRNSVIFSKNDFRAIKWADEQLKEETITQKKYDWFIKKLSAGITEEEFNNFIFNIRAKI